MPVRGFKPVEGWQYELLKEGFSRKVRRDKLISMLKSEEFQGWVRRLRDSFARSV